MNSNRDIDQARKWPVGTVEKMNEWVESQLGFSLEPWQMDWLRQMEDSLPDPLFLAKATHPAFGEGVIISRFPDDDGTVRFMFRDDRSWGGTDFCWVEPSTLTFHPPDHPVFLETEEDYANAPEGTVVSQDEGKPFVLINELWRVADSRRFDHDEMAGLRRRVLRWGDYS